MPVIRSHETHPGLKGTVSTHLARLATRTCLDLGVPPWEIARTPGLDDETLANGLLRVPSTSMAQLWELLGRADRHGGLRMAEAARPGSLHAWDYLFGTGESMEEGCREAARYLHTVAAPENRMEVERDGQLLTVRFHSPHAVGTTREAPAYGEFVLALTLRRIREYVPPGTTPVNVAFAHRVPDARLRRARLAEAFGSGSIDFGAPAHSITFISPRGVGAGAGVGSGAGAGAGGRRLDPELGRIVRGHAQTMLNEARPAACWHLRLQAVIREALQLGQPGLEWAAGRLAVSPRTVQRRLALQGSSWRDEVEVVRKEQAIRLLRETDQSVQSIASHLGYGDARTLRRAFQRWTGQAPAAFRRSDLPSGLAALSPGAGPAEGTARCDCLRRPPRACA